MSFIVRSNIGGPYSPIGANDEDEAVRQSALRLSLGIKVGPSNRKRARPGSPQPSPAALAAGGPPPASPVTQCAEASTAAANAEAAAAEFSDVQTAGSVANLAGRRAAHPPGEAGSPLLSAPNTGSAYDLAPLAFYAALKIG